MLSAPNLKNLSFNEKLLHYFSSYRTTLVSISSIKSNILLRHEPKLQVSPQTAANPHLSRSHLCIYSQFTSFEQQSMIWISFSTVYHIKLRRLFGIYLPLSDLDSTQYLSALYLGPGLLPPAVEYENSFDQQDSYAKDSPGQNKKDFC